MEELGRRMTPPRNRSIIQEALRLEGCPGRVEPGRYHIAKWQEFINAHFSSYVKGDEPDKLKLEMEKLKLQNEKLTFELRVKREDFIEKAVAAQEAGKAAMAAKTVLGALPGKLAPQVVGLTVVEAEKLLRVEINAALTQLHECPLCANYESLL